MTYKYKLDGHIAVPVDNPLEWAKWFETADRVVAKDQVGNMRVSTVFLGIDHSFRAGPPILFETMIFGGPFDNDEYQERYSTWDQAVAGHKTALEIVRRAKP